jgi:microcystin-dependent protein
MAVTPYIGQVQAFSFSFAPRGWALCQGQLLPINQNQALFALLGTFYGGNGTTNFALPNLQGRAVRGYGSGPGLSACNMGQVSGTENVTLLVSNLPPHNHNLVVTPGSGPKASASDGASPDPSATNNVIGQLNDPGFSALNNFYNNDTAPAIPLNTGSGAPSLSSSGSSQPVNIMQPYIAINYSIALVGIFPSRN